MLFPSAAVCSLYPRVSAPPPPPPLSPSPPLSLSLSLSLSFSLPLSSPPPWAPSSSCPLPPARGSGKRERAQPHLFPTDSSWSLPPSWSLRWQESVVGLCLSHRQPLPAPLHAPRPIDIPGHFSPGQPRARWQLPEHLPLSRVGPSTLNSQPSTQNLKPRPKSLYLESSTLNP